MSSSGRGETTVAGEVGAEDEGELRGGHAGVAADERVPGGDAGGLDADQDLASGGRGDGQIDDFDHLGRTEGFDLRCAHKAGSSQTAAGSWMPEASRPGTDLLTSKRAADGFARARGGAS